MPFDGTTDAKTATRAVLRGVLAYYGDGKTWTTEYQHDGQGRRCLAGALRHVRRTHGIRDDKARQYLRLAMLHQDCVLGGIMAFNDACHDYRDIRDMIVSALLLLNADMRGKPRPELRPWCRRPPAILDD